MRSSSRRSRRPPSRRERPGRERRGASTTPGRSLPDRVEIALTLKPIRPPARLSPYKDRAADLPSPACPVPSGGGPATGVRPSPPLLEAVDRNQALLGLGVDSRRHLAVRFEARAVHLRLQELLH